MHKCIDFRLVILIIGGGGSLLLDEMNKTVDEFLTLRLADVQIIIILVLFAWI